MEGESHFHPCPSCQSAVECLLAIGDGDCGKLRCANCSQPTKPAIRGYFLCSTGWICECGAIMGNDRDGLVAVCRECGRPKPTKDGHSEMGEAQPPAEPESSDEEAEAETCDNCGEDITPENPAMDFNGEERCKDCFPLCIYCEKPVDPDNYYTCERCSDYLCESHAQYCQCCEGYFCESHAEGHGI